MKTASTIRLAIAVLLVSLIVATLAFLPRVVRQLVSVLEAARDMGFWGPFLVGGVYVLGTLAFVPGSILTLGTGYVFGLLVGAITVSISSTLAAAIAFLAGRTVAREWMVRAARAAAEIRNAARFGIHVPDGVRVDFGAVMERMRKLRAEISPHDSAERFRRLGVDVFLGEGRFSGPDAIVVGGKTLRFRRAVIATGSRPQVPPIPGLAEARFLTNETVFSLTELPSRLAVIGAGPIGCEMAQALARLGSTVYLIEAAHGVLPKEDPDAAEFVRQSLICDGIQIRCCGENLRVSAGAKASGCRSIPTARTTTCSSMKSWSLPAARRTSSTWTWKPPASATIQSGV